MPFVKKCLLDSAYLVMNPITNSTTKLRYKYVTEKHVSWDTLQYTLMKSIKKIDRNKI